MADSGECLRHTAIILTGIEETQCKQNLLVSNPKEIIYSSARSKTGVLLPKRQQLDLERIEKKKGRGEKMISYSQQN